MTFKSQDELIAACDAVVTPEEFVDYISKESNGEPIEVSSRYSVFGPPNGCDSSCEGTGYIPIKSDETDPKLLRLWKLTEIVCPNKPDDDWHFIPCPKCKPENVTRLEQEASEKAVSK